MFDLDDALTACPGGGPASYSAAVALYRAAGIPAGATTVTPGQALAIWSGALLVGTLPDNLTSSVLAFIGSVRVAETRYAMWEFIAATFAPNDAVAPPALVVTGGTHVSLSSVKRVWELADGGRWVDAVPPGWLESRVFNLRTLYRNRAAIVEKLAQPCTTKPPRPSGPTPTPQPSAS